LRDRRTLMMMLVIPVLIFPIILNVFVSVSASFREEAANKKITIGWIGPEDNAIRSGLEEIPESLGAKELQAFSDSTAMKEAIRNDSIQFGIFIPADFSARVDSSVTGSITVFFNATELGMQERAQ